MHRRGPIAIVVMLFGSLLFVPAAASAALQAVPGISGSVVDAATGEPIDGVAVTLEARTGGAFPPVQGGFIRGVRTMTTDETGEYHFAGVPPGDYRLHVQRAGYASASADVTFRDAAESRVSFGLRVEPVALTPLEIGATAASPLVPNATRTHADALDRQRILAEQARQQAYLPGDVRVITRADVTDGVTLGETDLFRALQRLPGITTHDEYSAELWTRGARWDQTRVYFDGVPLFNPLHAAGVFSGINPDALGAALLHPGVQPTQLGGGVAAIELSTRRTPLHPEHRTFGELSLVSARLTYDLFTRSDRASGLVSVRRSYLDWLTRAIERVSGADDVHVPYHFQDIIVRMERQLGTTRSIEGSIFAASDALTGDVPDVLHGTDAQWGTGAARITFSTPLGALRSRHTAGLSVHGSNIWQAPRDSESGFSAPGVPPARNELLYVTLLGDVRPASDAMWLAGYEIVGQRGEYDGPRPGPQQDTPEPVTARLRSSAVHGAIWADRRWAPAERVVLQTGARIEAGAGSSQPRLAPRVAARWQRDSRLTLSAAAGRSYQYTQTVGPAGVRPVRGMHAEYVWLPAGDDVPVVTTDVVTAGAERWIGNAWIGSAALHARRTTGMAIPDPTPGAFLDNPLWVPARNTAEGVELSLRRLTGRVTGSLAWTLSRSTMHAQGVSFAAPEDRRHLLDATAQFRASRSWLFGAAYSLASPAPYTRTFAGSARTDSLGLVHWAEAPWIGEPSAHRGAATRGLDLLLEWQRDRPTWQGTVFMQLRNVLGRSGQGRYVGWEPAFQAGATGRDEFLPGMPLLPVIGFRFAF